MGTPHEDLHRLIDQLPPQLVGEVLDFAEFVRARHGAPSLDEDQAWLNNAATDLNDRLADLEVGVPPAEVAAWLGALDEGATTVKWDDQAGAFIEVGP